MLATTAWSMSGRLVLLPFVLLAASANLWATSNYVYHEATTNAVGCNGLTYRSVMTPAHNQTLTIAFKAEYQFNHNQARVYYTTDGSTPAGAFGVGTGTTQVVSGTFSCTFNSGGVVDVVTATIPGQIGGTTVKYIVSAWHDGGGDEIFGNGPSAGCNCGTPTNLSSLATVFDYTVSYANTYHYSGTGNWTDAGNWSPTYPGTTLAGGDRLIIDLGSSCTVPMGTTVTVNGDVTADGDLINNGTLLQNGDITISANGVNNVGATWTASGANAILFVENGVTFANLGTMSFTNNNASESAGMFSNKGTMTVDGNSSFTNSSLFSNGEGGMTNTANLTIHGDFYANAPFFNEDGATVYISNSGALDIMALFANNAGATLDNNGLIGDLGGNYGSNGLYKGSGAFDAPLFFNGSDGIVSPGASPGCQSFTGDFTNDSDGTITLEINGTTPCTQFDQLQVTGTFTAGGTLEVNFGSFMPTAGQMFQIVTAGTYAGSFSSINETPSSIVTSYNNGVLTVTSAGGVYTFSGTGNWSDAARWSPSYPGLTIAVGEEAIIAAGANCTIPNGTTVTINGTLTVNGTISKVAGSTLTNSSTGTVSVANGGALNNDAGNFNNAGMLTTVAGGTFGNYIGIFSNTGTYNNGGTHYSTYGGFTNGGTITNTGSMTSGQYINISNSGVWTNAAGGTMSMQSIVNAAAANLTNNGTMGIGLTNSGAFTNNLTFTQGYSTQSNAAGAVWTNSATGTMSLSCNPFSNSGTFNNAGSFSQTNCSGLGSFANSGTINLTGPMAVGSSIPGTNTGTININAGGSLLLTAGTHTLFTNNGTINYNAGTFTNNATYNGSGTFAAGVFNNTGGVVAPGASPGCLVFSAGYNNGTGTQAIEIGGATPCTQHDQIQVTGGTATLSGTLTITMFGGHIPGATTSYTILTAPGGVSGTFATINYPTVCGVTWSIAYNANDVVVTAMVSAQPEIDVQGNGVSIVDGDNTPSTADYTDFGNVEICGSRIRTFTISNTGSLTLNISGISSSNPLFTVGGAPTSILAGSSATFTVTFSTTALGLSSATITINNSDCNEGTYDFVVRGTGVSNFTQWTQLGGDIDGEAAGDNSGYSVSLSGDGTIMVIGARNNDGAGANAGQARVYQYNGAAWVQLGSDINGEAAGDLFGYSVAISSNGNRIAAGGVLNDGGGSDAGHVRVYGYNGSAWVQVGNDIDGEAAGDESGRSVALSADGSIVAIGAIWNDGGGNGSGQVRVYQLVSGNWVQLGGDINGDAAGDNAGFSVSLSSDGTKVAVGAYQNDGNGSNSGQASVYQYNGSAWVQLGADINGENAGDLFGTGVSLSSDGTRLAVGADKNDGAGTDAGHTRVYLYNGSAWVQIGADIDGEAAGDDFGYSVSLSSDGTKVAIGGRRNDGNGSNAGHVRVYRYNGSAWMQIASDINGEAANDETGNSVSLSSDGSVVAMGAQANSGNGAEAGHARAFAISTQAEINIQGGSPLTDITDGDNTPSTADHTDFGNVAVNGSLVRTFTIQNTGNADLTISSITSSNPTKFTIGALTPASPISGPNGTATFTVTFLPTAAGVQNATITINNNDCTEAVYDFAVTGTGVTPASALNFDGIDDYITTANNTTLDLSTQTVEFWAKPNSSSGDNDLLVGKRNYNATGSNDIRWSIHFKNGNQGLYFFSPAGTADWTYTFTPNQWYHIAMVTDATSTKLYIDGTLISSMATTINSPTNLPVIFGASAPNYEVFPGSLDEVRIWNTARTCDQITQLRNCELTGSEPNLVAYYKFNQGFAAGDNTTPPVNTLTDATANGNNGTLTGFDLNGAVSNWVTPGGVTTGTSCPAVTAPEADVRGGSPLTTIADGDITPSTTDHTDFGDVLANGSLVRSFTIQNTGNADLTISSITSSNPAIFTIGAFTSPITPGNSATFTVTFSPTATGVENATITINNNDCDEAAYDFAVTGNGVLPDYTITTTGGNLVITDNAGNGDQLDVTQDGMGIKFTTTPVRTYALNGGAAQFFPVTITNVAAFGSIEINQAGGNDNLNAGTFNVAFPSLKIDGGGGTDVAIFSGAVTYATNKNLEVVNAETVTVNGGQTLSGTGSINITANQITVNSQLTNASGNINLSTAGAQDILVQAGINGINSTAGILKMQAGRDLLFGSAMNYGDARGQTVELTAGRDVIVSNNTYVQSDGPGGIKTEAGRNLTVTSTSLINSNGGAAANQLTTAANGLLTIDVGSNIGANGGPITVSADNVTLDGAMGTNTVVTIQPVTAGRGIDLGTNTSGILSLTEAELDQITTGTLIIGNANSGDITVSAAISRSASTNVQLVSGGDVRISGGGFDTGGGTMLLDPGTSPAAVKPTFNGTDVMASTLSFASDLSIAINGTTAGDGTGSTYSQLNVVGTVNLTGVDLLFTGSYIPTGNETFIIVVNDGTDFITGTFTGLAEGAILPNFRGSGLNATISYMGGTGGNDVVITVGTPAAALNFDGNDDFVAVPDANNLDLGPSLTLEAWVKPESFSTYNMIIDKRDLADVSANYGLTLNNGKPMFYFWNGGNQSFHIATNPIALNAFAHLAATYDGAMVRIFVNGTQVYAQAETDALPTNNQPLSIGRNQVTLQYFDGDIDEVRIWNTVRTCEEIKQLRNCELSVPQTGLVAYYKFNQGTAAGDNTTPPVNTLTDATANANNGTLNGFALNGATSNWVTPGGVTTGTSCPASITAPEINVQGGSPLVTIVDGDNTPSTTEGTDFGSILYSGSVVRTFTIQNTGDAVLNIGSITSSNTKYVVSGAPTSVAANGGSATFMVTFTPAETGTHTATITVNSDDCDEAVYDFAVTGTATFPVTTIGFDCINGTIGTYYNGGSGPNVGIAFATGHASGGRLNAAPGIDPVINIPSGFTTAFALNAGVDVGYNITIKDGPNGTGNTLAAKGDCPASGNCFVTFSGVAKSVTLGRYSGGGSGYDNLTFGSTTIGTPVAESLQEINLQGNGQTILDGDATPSTADHTNFGNVLVNGSLQRTFTIQNAGTADLTVSSISSSNNARFTVGALTPASPIPAGMSATFTVTFNPIANGAQNATITVNNDDCSEAVYDFAVTGIGVTSAAALHFDGSNDYVEVPYNAVLDITGNVTLEAWVKTSISTEQYIISRANSSYLLAVNPTNDAPGKAAFYMHGPSPAWLYSSTRIDDGNWHHVACVRNGTTAQIFIDGVLNATGTVDGGNIGTSTDPLGIGWRSTYPTFVFNGSVDEVRIWNTARSCEEIRQLRNCELSVPQSGLVAYYKFNQGIAAGDNTTPPVNSLTDATANGNHGTLTNFTLNGATSNWVTPGGVTTGTSCPAVSAPEVNVKGNAIDISNGDATPATGDHTDFSTTAFSRTFTIFNDGNSALNISNITVSGGNAGDFNITAGWPTSIAMGSSGTFTVNFAPTAAGLRTTTVRITSDDCDEADYDFAIQATAVAGAALNFDGTDDYVTIPTAGMSSAAGTISFWMNAAATQPMNSSVMVDLGNGENTNIFLWNNGTQIYFRAGGVGSQTSAIPFTGGSWKHVAMTWSGVGQPIKAYIDGALVATVTQTGAVSFASTGYLGRSTSYANGVANLLGSLDEVQLWSRALCQAEIQHNMSCELPGGQTGLQAYWKFNQGFAGANNMGVTALTDASGNSNTGTLTGFALNGATSNWVTPGAVTTGTSCSPYLQPDINVKGGSPLTSIPDGDATPSVAEGTNFGSVNIGANTTQTFTIENTGDLLLNVSGVTFTGADAADFSVMTAPASTVAATNGTTTFVVKFAPTTTGTKTAVMRIANDDCDEADYDIAIQGTAACIAPSFSACPTGPLTATTVAGTCAAPVSYTATATGTPTPTLTYAFTGATTGTNSGDGSGLSFNKGITTVTLTASSTCAPNATCSFTVTVNDNEAPTITCANNVTINTTTNQCTGTTTLTLPTIGDNCAGTLGNALHYSGSSEVTAPNTGLPTGNDARTVEFWVKIPSNSQHHIVSWGNFTCAIYPISGVMRPHLWGSFNDVSSTTLSVPLNTWTHIAYVLTGTQLIFYVNGVADAKTYTHNTGATGSLYVGSYAGATGQTVDEVRIWNTARTPAQILNNIGAQLVGNEPGLVAYYKFNQGTAGGNNMGLTTLNATTGQNGTLAGFTLNGATSNWVAGVAFPTVTGNTLSAYPKGNTVVTWTATDASGNTKTCEQTVTVNDNQAPTLANPGNQSLNVAAGTCTATYTLADPITDNCTGSTWSATFSGNANGNPANLTNIADGTSGGAITFQKGTTTVTLTGTDASSNAATQTSFTVTVTDNETPKVTACFGTTISAFGQATGNSVTLSSNSTYQSFTAPVTGVITSIQIQVGGASGLTLQVGNGTSCGGTVLGSKAFNSVGGLQTITFDTPIPVTGGVMYNFGILGNHTAGWATTGSYAGGQMYYNGCPGSPAFPNSDLVFTVNMNYVPPISLNVAPGTCTQSYAIPAPTITDNCAGPLTWNATFSGNPNGNPSNLTGLADGSPTGLISFAKGTTNVVLNGVDANGNISTTTCPFTVTVVDDEKPAITCAADVTVNTTANLCTGTTTLADPTVTDNCPLVLGNGLHFDGSNDLVNASGLLASSPTQFTIEFWLNPASRSDYNQEISIGSAGNGHWNGFTFHTTSTGAVYVGTDIGSRMSPSEIPDNTVVLNTWQHFAYVLSGGTGRFYKNGVLLATKANGVPPSFDVLRIASGCCNPIHGILDELRIWNIARTQAQIQGAMKSELSGSEGNLVAYYNFNQGTAGGSNGVITTLPDLATGIGGANNGTLTGFALSGATSNWVTGVPITNLTNDAPATYPKGNTTVTWTATDASGNTKTCQQTVTVNDNEAPTVTCPANTTILDTNAGASCQITIPDYAAALNPTDNCTASGSIVENQTPSAGVYTVSGDGSTVTVTYTATDDAATPNTRTCTVTITVNDNIAPTVTCPANMTVVSPDPNTPCSITIPDFVTGLNPTDNCTASGSIVEDQMPSPGAYTISGDGAVVTLNYMATDGASPANTKTCTVTISVVAPEINVKGNGMNITDGSSTPSTSDDTDFGATTGTPITKTFTIENTGHANLVLGTGSITFTGTNASLFSVSNITLPTTVSGPSGTITFDVTYTPVGVGMHTAEVNIANNDCGEAIYNFAIQGTRNCSPASFTVCPTSPVTANNDLNQCNAVVNYTATTDGTPAPTLTYARSGAVTDNGNGTGSGLSFPVGTTMVTITATNPCSAPTCTFNVVVTDNQKPTFTCPTPTLVLNTTGGSNCQVVIPDLVALVTDANDNCALKTSNPITQDIAAGNYNGVSDGMTIPVVVTVTDNASPANSETCTVTFTVNDDKKPTFTCPTPTLVLNTTGGANCQVVIPDLVALVTNASDNCALKTSNPITQNVAAGNYNGVSDGMTIPVTVTVTDNATPANSESCVVTFTVNDDDAPTFTCPTPTMVLNTTGGANCQVQIPDLVALVTNASDNCALKTTSPITQSVAAGNYNGVSDGMSIPVVVTVTDNASPANSESCTVTFTVNDDDAPTVTCPTATATINTNAGASCEITVPNYVTMLSPTDNCTASGNIVEAQSIPAGAYNVSGDGATVTVNYTATDGASPANTVTCTVVITVNDDDAPTVTCPAATATVNTNAGASCEITIPNYVTSLTATDNCSAVMEAQSIAAGAYSVSGHGATVTVNYTATDGASPANTTTCTIVITVNDDDAPTISCPTNQTVPTAPDNCSTPPVTYTVTTTDNCSSTVSLVSGLGSGSVFPLGVNTVVWRATDAGGNSTTCAFTVTVGDGQNPSIVCPSSISRNTDANQCTALVAYATPTVSDNCTGWTLTRTGGLGSGSAFPPGVNMVQWQVSDVGGNSAVCQFTVTVTDAQAPVIACPANIVRSTDAGQCHATVTYATPTATDNCGVSGVTLQSPTNTASGSQFSKGTTVVIWRATDTATPTANTATCSFTVTVNDTQLPNITCPSNQTVGNTPGSCSATVTYATPAYSDNCAGGGATLQSGLPSGGIFPKGQTTVIWRATDAVGLTKTCSFRVTVNDTEAPVITCPGSQSASTAPNLCTANVSYSTPTATDNCPGAVTVVRVSGPTSGSAFPLGMTTVIWRAIDVVGRSSTCSFTVTVADNQPPTISCPGNIAATGSGSPCQATVTYATPTASDNCSGTLTPALVTGLSSGSTFPAGATVNTWQAIAANGQSSTCSFTVTVSCGANSEQGAASREQSAPETSVDALRALSFSLAPNPAQDEVRVSIENLGATGGELALYDARGRLMWQQRVESSVVGRQSSAVSLADFPTGVYFVTLRSEGQTLTKRLMVQRL